MANIPIIGNNHGFTLLEVMISLAILATVLVSVLNLHSQTLEIAATTRFDQTAAQMAQEIFNAQITAKADEPLFLQGNFQDKYPGFEWEATQELVPLYGEDENAPQLMRLDVTVSHTGISSGYHLRGYYYKPK